MSWISNRFYSKLYWKNCSHFLRHVRCDSFFKRTLLFGGTGQIDPAMDFPIWPYGSTMSHSNFDWMAVLYFGIWRYGTTITPYSFALCCSEDLWNVCKIYEMYYNVMKYVTFIPICVYSDNNNNNTSSIINKVIVHNIWRENIWLFLLQWE